MSETEERPRSVTVIGWFFVIAGGISVLASGPLALAAPEPLREVWPQIYVDADPVVLGAFFVAASALGLWCGWGLLVAKAIARSVTVGYLVVASLASFVLYPFEPLFVLNGLANVAFTAAVWYFLYQPAVSEYLGRSAAP